jgi:hypothetical protein
MFCIGFFYGSGLRLDSTSTNWKMSMQDLYVALALVLVIEGIMPFVSPEKWRVTVIMIAQQSDKVIRMIGLGAMLLGLLLVTLLRSGSGS